MFLTIASYYFLDQKKPLKISELPYDIIPYLLIKDDLISIFSNSLLLNSYLKIKTFNRKIKKDEIKNILTLTHNELSVLFIKELKEQVFETKGFDLGDKNKHLFNAFIEEYYLNLYNNDYNKNETTIPKKHLYLYKKELNYDIKKIEEETKKIYFRNSFCFFSKKLNIDKEELETSII